MPTKPSFLRLCLSATLVVLLSTADSLGAQDQLKRGGIDWPQGSSGLELDLSAGVAVSTDGGDPRAAVTLTARRHLTRMGSTRVDLAVSLMALSNRKGLPVASSIGNAPAFDENCVPPYPPEFCDINSDGFPDVFEDPFFGFDPDQLDLGNALALIPGFEWTWCDNCLQPSFSIGAGVLHAFGRTTAVGDLGHFESEADTYPVLSLGGSISKCLTDKLELHLEARTLTVFYDQIEVTARDGSRASFDGETETSLILSAGLTITF